MLPQKIKLKKRKIDWEYLKGPVAMVGKALAAIANSLTYPKDMEKRDRVLGGFPLGDSEKGFKLLKLKTVSRGAK